MKISYDLHIHSCLSPCGDNDMTPNNIVNMASLLGLDIIAVSDHNSASNLPAVFAAANAAGITVVPAIEVCTAEEVHILCLFERFENALDFAKESYEYLPNIKNNIEVFGEQLIMDENDQIIGHEPRLLINAYTYSIDKLLKLLIPHNGFAIPAHVDKNANSIISNLGFIPPDYGFTCIEQKDITRNIEFLGNKITNSDAHYLENMNEPTNFIEVDEKSPIGVINSLKKTKTVTR